MRCKREEILYKILSISDSAKPLHLPCGDTGTQLDRGTQVAGQSQLVQLNHCVHVKKGGCFYTHFQPSRKSWSCLGALKEKGKKFVLIYYPLTNYDMRIIVNESKVVINFVLTIL